MNCPSNDAEFELNQQSDCHFQMQDFKVIWQVLIQDEVRN